MGAPSQPLLLWALQQPISALNPVQPANMGAFSGLLVVTSDVAAGVDSWLVMLQDRPEEELALVWVWAGLRCTRWPALAPPAAKPMSAGLGMLGTGGGMAGGGMAGGGSGAAGLPAHAISRRHSLPRDAAQLHCCQTGPSCCQSRQEQDGWHV